MSAEEFMQEETSSRKVSEGEEDMRELNSFSADVRVEESELNKLGRRVENLDISRVFYYTNLYHMPAN
jgi:hypothetical protein